MIYSGYERRLTLRLLAYWEKHRQGGGFPALEAVNPADLHDLWADCFVLRLAAEGGQSNYEFSHCGSDVAPWLEGLLDEYLPVMQASGEPLVHEGEHLEGDGKVLKYRFCLLPLGAQGGARGVLGGLRAKNFEK